jgi:hypothetical protein
VQIDLDKQLPNLMLFIKTRRRLAVFLSIGVGALALVMLLLPSDQPSKDAFEVNEGFVAVPIQVADPAVIEVVKAGDFVDVMATSPNRVEGQGARRVASRVRVLAALANVSGKDTLVVEATEPTALSLAGAMNDLISVAVLPK